MVTILVKKGFTIKVESGAGKEAKFPDIAYQGSGAKIVDNKAAFSSGNCCRKTFFEELC